MTRPLRGFWAWLKAGLREAFYGRRPRRARCACGCPWRVHFSNGCQRCRNAMPPYACNLNRKGIPIRAQLKAVP